MAVVALKKRTNFLLKNLNASQTGRSAATMSKGKVCVNAGACNTSGTRQVCDTRAEAV